MSYAKLGMAAFGAAAAYGMSRGRASSYRDNYYALVGVSGESGEMLISDSTLEDLREELEIYARPPGYLIAIFTIGELIEGRLP